MVFTEASSRNVGIASEAYAAAVLAQADYNVSIQYGPNQVGYDLIAEKNGKTACISVKGNKDGGWPLTASYKGMSPKDKARIWLEDHRGLIFFLVQFKSVRLGEMPRIYVANAQELHAQIIAQKSGHGDTVLKEKHIWRSGMAEGTTDEIPSAWKLSPQRLIETLKF
jgi:Holliday junction resolvase-like predicted endonuclease